MASDLAIDGGPPVRGELLPYGRQTVDEDDILAVTRVLRSDWLTTGPEVDRFERAFGEYVEAAEAVAVNNGTAAIQAALFAIGLEPGDEVIVPTMTFAATANSVLHLGGRPVFADVDPDTLLLDPEDAGGRVTSRTRAVIAVDYAGQPADYRRLRALADRHGLALLSDAAHALGARDADGAVGSIADVTTFSLHPVKHVTAGEGGVVTTNDPARARRARLFRNHGITTEFRERADQGAWFYEMEELGQNFRITDFQCALAASQLEKLPAWLARRREIAARYDRAFADQPGLRPLATRDGALHAYHLYVVRLSLDELDASRDEVFAALRAEGIGVNVHYIPVHLHPYYRRELGTRPGSLPVAEDAYTTLLSLPMFHGMESQDVDDVITAVGKVLTAYRRS